MKRLVITKDILNCTRCPHFDCSGGGRYCVKSDGRHISDPYEFPEWCPLEDANATEEFLARFSVQKSQSQGSLIEAKDKEIELLNSNICDLEDLIAALNQQIKVDNRDIFYSIKSILSARKELRNLKKTEQPEAPRKLDLD